MSEPAPAVRAGARPSGERLIRVEGVSKKFCRSLRYSLWYGMRDLGTEMLGRRRAAHELRKHEFWALRDVTFDIAPGENIGLIGPNGAGKTTLLRMLNGLIKPDAGRIAVRGRMQALIALGAGFNPVLSGRENVYVNASVLGIPKAEVDRRFDEIVEFSGIGEFIDSPVQSYSSGMAVRLGFAVAAHVEPDVLLVDEVLAVGDEGFQNKCVNKIGELSKRGAAIVLVSHNMHTISTYSTRVVLMDRGQFRIYDDVSAGVHDYRRLFSEVDAEVEKHCSGNERIRFDGPEFERHEHAPGDDFSVGIRFRSSVEYLDAEIDTTIRSTSEAGYHFQATNKAYGRRIDLLPGEHELRLRIRNVRINSATARIDVAIWARRRTELLLWWMIPVRFRGMPHSTGHSFLDMDFAID